MLTLKDEGGRTIRVAIKQYVVAPESGAIVSAVLSVFWRSSEWGS